MLGQFRERDETVGSSAGVPHYLALSLIADAQHASAKCEHVSDQDLVLGALR
jgi:hypothetical protein